MAAAATCKRCSKSVEGEQKYFSTTKGLVFHTDCFKCDQCEQPLSTKQYMEQDGKFYDEDCYHSFFSPVCAHCHENIKGPYVTALEQDWHPEHFVCNLCNKNFDSSAGQFAQEDDLPYHEGCLRIHQKCECLTCGKTIVGPYFTVRDKKFHKEHFQCCVDQKLIDENDTFKVHEDKLYCGKHYHEIVSDLKPCFRCSKSIENKYINAGGNHYHQTCWTCCKCGTNLQAPQKFRQLLLDFSCESCYEAAPEADKKETAEIIARQAAGKPPNHHRDGSAIVANGVTGAFNDPSGPPPFMGGSDEDGLADYKREYFSGTADERKKKREQLEKEMNGKHTLSDLQPLSQFNGTAYRCRLEMFLSDAEFQKIFKMDKVKFKTLKLWRQQRMKKYAGLF